MERIIKYNLIISYTESKITEEHDDYASVCVRAKSLINKSSIEKLTITENEYLGKRDYARRKPESVKTLWDFPSDGIEKLM